MYETLLFVPIVFTNLLITSLKCLLLVALLCYLHSSLARVKKISVRILVRFLFIYCVYSCFISPFTFFSSLDFEGLDSQRVGSPSPPLPHQVRIFLTKIFAFVYIRYFCFNHCLLFLPFSLGEGDTN